MGEDLITELTGRSPLGDPILKRIQDLPPLGRAPDQDESIIGLSRDRDLIDFLRGGANTGRQAVIHDQAMRMRKELSKRIVTVQLQTGLGPDIVERNFEALEAEVAKRKRISSFSPSEFIRSSPIVAQWINLNPHYESMSRDQVSNLGNLESLVKRHITELPIPENRLLETATIRAQRKFDAFQKKAAPLRAIGVGSPPRKLQEFIDAEFAIAKSEEAFIAGDEGVGFFEAVGKRSRENPAFFIPFVSGGVDAQRIFDLYMAAKAVEKNSATPEQVDMLVRFGRLSATSDRRGTTVWGDVASIVAELPAFVGEFAATGGIYTGVKGVLLRGGKEAAEHYMKRMVFKALRTQVGARVTAVAVQSTVAGPGRIIKGTFERMTPGGRLELEDGTILFSIIPGTGEPFIAALSRAWVDNWAEMASERTGRFFTLLDRPINNVLFRSWARRIGLGGTSKRFKETMNRLGIHGILGEMAEEEVGALMKAALPLPFVFTSGPAYALPLTEGGTTGQMLLAEAIAFAPGAGLSSIGGRRTKSNPAFFKNMSDLVQKIMEKDFKETPQIIEEILGRSVEGSGREFVYVPATEWVRFWQERADPSGEFADPDKIAEEVLDDITAYKEAVRLDGEIQIPLERFAMTISRNPSVSTFFQAEAKLDPTEENEREEKERQDQDKVEVEQVEVVAEGVGPKGKLSEEGLNPTAEEPGREEERTGEPIPSRREPGDLPDISPGSENVVSFKDLPGLQEKLKEKGLAPAVPRKRVPGGPPIQPSLTTKQEDDSTLKVFDAVVDSLKQANLQNIEGLKGLSPEDIRRMATLLSERARIRARVRGVDPFTLFRSDTRTFVRLLDAESTAAGETFFQPEEGEAALPRGPRGRTRISIAGIEIGFLKGADLSTFFHETGHVWLLEVRADAQALERLKPEDRSDSQIQLIEDGKTILKFLGIEKWEDMTKEVTEKWAVGIEQYFVDGKAPSRALRKVFQVFKQWMRRVYNLLTGAGVTLDPEIRGVMDRLIASEQEMQYVREIQQVDTLFTDSRAVGMGPEKAARYAETVETARQNAEDALSAKLMVKLRRRNEKEFKAEKVQVVKETLTKLGQDPVFRAFSVLSRGTLPDGVVPDLPSGLRPYKLSRESILEEAGPEMLKALPRSVWAVEGIDIDVAAKDFGFESGQTLLSGLNEIYERERQAAPIFQREKEIETQIERLEGENRNLEEERDAVKQLAKGAKKTLRKGKKTLANRLEKTLATQERESLGEIREIHKSLRAAGGIRPVVTTKLLPKTFTVKRGRPGVPSDIVAQNLFDQGVIDDPGSDTLFDWLNETLKQIKQSKERLAAIPARARKMATQQLEAAIEGVIKNTEAIGRLQKDLKAVRKDRTILERSLEIQGKVDNIVDRIADEIMEDRHPSVDTEEEMREEAVKALHTELRSKVMVAELKHLVSAEFATFKGLAQAITGTVKTLPEYRLEAESFIATLPIRQIVSAQFLRAQERSARKARTAFFNGDFQGAFEAKQKELESHELFRAARKSVDESGRMVKFFKKTLERKRQEELARAKGGYRDKINQLLEGIELKDLSDPQIKRRQNFKAWAESVFEETGETPVIPEKYEKEFELRNWREMPFGELLEIFQMVKNFDHLATVKNKLRGAVEAREFQSARDQGERTIIENKPEILPPERFQRSPLNVAKRTIVRVDKILRDLPNLIRELDGWKLDSMWELVQRPLNEAGDREDTMKIEAAKKLRDIFGIHSSADWRGMYKQNRHFKSIGLSLSRMERIMIALNSGNLDSRQKLREGLGLTRDSGLPKEERLNRPVEDTAIQEVIFTLDEKDVKFVQAVLDYYQTFWPEVKALSERADGIPAEEVEATGIVTRHGTIRGGYFNLSYDERQSEGATRDLAKEAADRTFRGATVRATTRHGHREARVAGVQRPIQLDFSVIFNHVGAVIHDVTHYEPLIGVNRILGDQRIRDAIVNRYGEVHYSEMVVSLDEIARGERAVQNVVAEWANWLRRGTATAVLGMKATTALVQIFGLASSIVRVGPKWMWAGIKRSLGSAVFRTNTIKQIYKESSFMKNRPITMNREVNEIQNRIKRGGKFVTGFQSLMLWATVRMQTVVDVPTYLGAQMRALEELGYKKAKSKAEDDRIYATSIQIANQAVRDTQGTGHVRDMARVLRGNAFQKLWTMFLTYFSKRWNLAREIIGKAQFTPFGVGRAAIDMMVLYAVPSVLATLTFAAVRGQLDDDDEQDKTLLDDVMLNLAMEPLSDVIGIREIPGMLKGFKYKGPAGAKVFGELGDLFIQFGQGEVDESLLRKLNDVAGILFHYPAEQLENSVRGYTAFEEGKAGPGAIIFGPGARK